MEQPDRPTAKFDSLLIKGDKVSELIKQFHGRVESKDFQTVNKVPAHVKHREKAGWVFDAKDSDTKDPYFKLTKIS